TLVACVRVPHETKPGRRRQEVRSFATTTKSLLELADWLYGLGVTRVVMESTSTYWKPPFYLLEDEIECWVVNARDVKNVPGRPKTDKLDAVWLAKLAERGMLRASFIPSRPQRQLRDLTRYRRTLTQERTREKQRAEKLLEDAQIKLSAVISDIFGASGRAMLDALIGGQRNPHALAALAYRNMRAKTSVLQEALAGHFTDHHAFMLGMMLARIDALTTQVDTLTTRIGEAIAPFAAQVAQLDEIPGIGITAAQDILAEIGTDMSRFPTPGHLVSWAKFAPRARQSAGRSKAATTGKGNPWLGGTLGEAATSAARTKTFLASRYKRIARRRGKQRALVAVGNSLLTIIWHLLSDPAARFTDLGPDWHDRLAPLRRKRQLIAELERLSGKKVTLNDAA
ncbi:MAG TPA: IS110 family transposase, partial [Streptosporangiaceae bacterium]|nr:IS110 family transposase [Streptosporangiaceae bacterium]